MRFMMSIRHPRDYDVSQVPPSLFGAMGAFVEEHVKNGMFIDGAGLQPLAKATRVRLAGGKITVSDGPFREAKEVVGDVARRAARGQGRRCSDPSARQASVSAFSVRSFARPFANLR